MLSLRGCLVFPLLVSIFSLLVAGTKTTPKTITTTDEDYLYLDEEADAAVVKPQNDKSATIKPQNDKSTTIKPQNDKSTTIKPENDTTILVTTTVKPVNSTTTATWVQKVDDFVEKIGKNISVTLNISDSSFNVSLNATLTAIGSVAAIFNITEGRNKSTDLEHSKYADVVAFYLYTSKEDLSKNERIFMYDNKSVLDAGYNSSRPILMIIHGISDNFTSEIPQGLKDEYLQNDIDANVIVVDWGQLATPHSGFFNLLMHAVTVKNFVTVGERITTFIRFLVSVSVLSGPEEVHIVGFGVGAHIAGIAGDRLIYTADPTESGTEKKLIKRITGLDPTGLLFLLVNKTNRLDKEDATFVDIVHTNQGISGYLGSLGNADFFPNGGGPYQPACKNKPDKAFPGNCAHRKAYEFFRMSIGTSSMIGCECTIWYDKKCRKECKSSAIFGQNCPFSARGKFFLEISGDLNSQPQKQGNSKPSATTGAEYDD